jgi:hypothetical protein
MKPLSEVIGHGRPCCSFITQQEREQRIICYRFHEALETVDRLWSKTFMMAKSASDSVKSNPSVGDALRSRSFGEKDCIKPVPATSGRHSISHIDPLADLPAQSIANRAVIEKLSSLLHDELSWLNDIYCSAKDLIHHMPDDDPSFADQINQLWDLKDHCERVTQESNRLIDREVYD